MSREGIRYLKLNPELVSERDVKLATIITETHPEIPPTILQSSLGIISSLMPYMTDDSEQVKMLLRGGTFRNYFYGNTIYDNAFYASWNNLATRGESSLADAVVQHLCGPMDIDIRLNEKDVEVQENQAIRPHDANIPKIIDNFLNASGWQKTKTTDASEALFERQQGEFIVQIVSTPIGKTEKRPLHNVIFRRADNESIVLELSMADLARTKTEVKEDIRCLNNGSSADSILVGEILQDNSAISVEDQLMVRGFFQEKEDGWEEVIFDQAVEKGQVGPHVRYLSNFAESAIEGTRVITWFMSHWSSSLRYFGDDSLESIVHSMRNLKIYANIPPEEKARVRTQLEGAVKEQKKSIQELIVPLLSDRLYLVSANPYLGIILSYAHGLLDTMNLGKIINSEERLIKFLGNIAKTTKYPQDKTWEKHTIHTLVNWYFAACLNANTDPLVLLDALKSLDIPKDEAEELLQIGLHPSQIPRTVTGLLSYLLPIGLSFN